MPNNGEIVVDGVFFGCTEIHDAATFYGNLHSKYRLEQQWLTGLVAI
jgi:hypothetical protein